MGSNNMSTVKNSNNENPFNNKIAFSPENNNSIKLYLSKKKNYKKINIRYYTDKKSNYTIK